MAEACSSSLAPSSSSSSCSFSSFCSSSSSAAGPSTSFASSLQSAVTSSLNLPEAGLSSLVVSYVGSFELEVSAFLCSEVLPSACAAHRVVAAESRWSTSLRWHWLTFRDYFDDCSSDDGPFSYRTSACFAYSCQDGRWEEKADAVSDVHVALAAIEGWLSNSRRGGVEEEQMESWQWVSEWADAQRRCLTFPCWLQLLGVIRQTHAHAADTQRLSSHPPCHAMCVRAVCAVRVSGEPAVVGPLDFLLHPEVVLAARFSHLPGPPAPPRPLSAYSLFFTEHPPLLLQWQPELAVREVPHAVGQMWASCDHEDRAVYRQRSAQQAAEYQASMRLLRLQGWVEEPHKKQTKRWDRTSTTAARESSSMTRSTSGKRMRRKRKWRRKRKGTTDTTIPQRRRYYARCDIVDIYEHAEERIVVDIDHANGHTR